jgi:hydrogenase maturation protein HypF
MDGTGFGPDGTVWGGEFLVADEAGFERAGHLGCFPLPGGDAAVKQPWRVAAALLMEGFGEDWRDFGQALGIVPVNVLVENLEAMVRQRIRTGPTSSLGRVFDAVACLLGIRRQVSFEGQAAMELEACADPSVTRALDYGLIRDQGLVLDLLPAVRQLVRERIEGRPAAELAGAFHSTLVQAFVKTAERIREASGRNRAVLSGGCFQNRILLEGCLTGLRGAGFEVYSHGVVPTNDGGISLGQALVAGTVAGRE